MSSTRTVLLSEATEQDLRQYAQETMGLPAIHPAAKRATIIAKLVEAGFPADKPDAVLVLMAPAEQVGAGSGDNVVKPQAPVQNGKEPRKYVTVFISSHEDKGGDQPIPLGVNGRQMLVERDKDQTIPEEYFKVLENSVTYRYDPLEGGGISTTPRKVPMYPYRVVREAHVPAAPPGRKAA